MDAARAGLRPDARREHPPLIPFTATGAPLPAGVALLRDVVRGRALALLIIVPMLIAEFQVCIRWGHPVPHILLTIWSGIGLVLSILLLRRILLIIPVRSAETPVMLTACLHAWMLVQVLDIVGARLCFDSALFGQVPVRQFALMFDVPWLWLGPVGYWVYSGRVRAYYGTTPIPLRPDPGLIAVVWLRTPALEPRSLAAPSSMARRVVGGIVTCMVAAMLVLPELGRTGRPMHDTVIRKSFTTAGARRVKISDFRNWEDLPEPLHVAVGRSGGQSVPGKRPNRGLVTYDISLERIVDAAVGDRTQLVIVRRLDVPRDWQDPFPEGSVTLTRGSAKIVLAGRVGKRQYHLEGVDALEETWTFVLTSDALGMLAGPEGPGIVMQRGRRDIPFPLEATDAARLRAYGTAPGAWDKEL